MESNFKEWLESFCMSNPHLKNLDANVFDEIKGALKDAYESGWEDNIVYDWISVDDKMPAANHLVIVTNEEGDRTVGSYEVASDGGCWKIGNDCVAWDYCFNCDYTVTHWAELPAVEIPEKPTNAGAEQMTLEMEVEVVAAPKPSKPRRKPATRKGGKLTTVTSVKKPKK